MQKIGYYRKSGELFLQNINLEKLGDYYGTPTFVYDSNLKFREVVSGCYMGKWKKVA